MPTENHGAGTRNKETCQGMPGFLRNVHGNQISIQRTSRRVQLQSNLKSCGHEVNQIFGTLYVFRKEHLTGLGLPHQIDTCMSPSGIDRGIPFLGKALYLLCMRTRVFNLQRVGMLNVDVCAICLVRLTCLKQRDACLWSVWRIVHILYLTMHPFAHILNFACTRTALSSIWQSCSSAGTTSIGDDRTENGVCVTYH